MKHLEPAARAREAHQAALDASAGAGTEAFWRMREQGASGTLVQKAPHERPPTDLPPGAALADKQRRVMRQPGRAAGGRRFR